MTSLLTEYWSQMDGTIHPDDRDVFSKKPYHAFDLNYPPPAFIGDIRNAPIIILDNNGGLSPIDTPAEFQASGASDEYRRRLRQSLVATDDFTAPYYMRRNFAMWLKDGTAALVNGVAYRSVGGSSSGVAELTKLLPSAAFNRQWLMNEILPLVRRNRRFLIVHRWGRWLHSVDSFRMEKNAIFAKHPHYRSPDLSPEEQQAARIYLASAT